MDVVALEHAEGLRGSGTNSDAGGGYVVVDGYDGRGAGTPSVVKGGAHVVVLVFAGVPGKHAIVLKASDNYRDRIVPEGHGSGIAAAEGTAVGDVAIGFVVDDFAFEESADAFVG